MADRYSYVAYIGFTFMLVCLLYMSNRGKTILKIPVMVIVEYFAIYPGRFMPGTYRSVAQY